mmetsp:Transcript_11502/g.27867  ORF Transcript_11502/g.27867 Transcript_11502/m.27867 type:complete len:200 (+) Transcript_11502:147-746(+)
MPCSCDARAPWISAARRAASAAFLAVFASSFASLRRWAFSARSSSAAAATLAAAPISAAFPAWASWRFLISRISAARASSRWARRRLYAATSSWSFSTSCCSWTYLAPWRTLSASMIDNDSARSRALKSRAFWRSSAMRRCTSWLVLLSSARTSNTSSVAALIQVLRASLDLILSSSFHPASARARSPSFSSHKRLCSA